MVEKEFYYPSSDNRTRIHGVEWTGEKKPVGIIVIAHGVTEYILRYRKLAQYFTDKGYVLFGNDHIGHGTSVSENSKKMYFGAEGSWKYVVKDYGNCVRHAKEKYPDLPLFVLGFSLGSFVVRTYLITSSEKIAGAIIIGTGYTPSLMISLAQSIAKKEAKKYGEEYTSDTIKKLTFETYNKKFAPNRTYLDWLCSDDEALDEYLESPLRGENMSSGLFRELLSGMEFTGRDKNIDKMDKNIKILLLSGEDDSVGDMGKGVKKVYKKFEKSGVKDINMKLYPKLRHDILNEKGKDEIYKDIFEWLNRIV